MTIHENKQFIPRRRFCLFSLLLLLCISHASALTEENKEFFKIEEIARYSFAESNVPGYIELSGKKFFIDQSNDYLFALIDEDNDTCATSNIALKARDRLYTATGRVMKRRQTKEVVCLYTNSLFNYFRESFAVGNSVLAGYSYPISMINEADLKKVTIKDLFPSLDPVFVQLPDEQYIASGFGGDQNFINFSYADLRVLLGFNYWKGNEPSMTLLVSPGSMIYAKGKIDRADKKFIGLGRLFYMAEATVTIDGVSANFGAFSSRCNQQAAFCIFKRTDDDIASTDKALIDAIINSENKEVAFKLDIYHNDGSSSGHMIMVDVSSFSQTYLQATSAQKKQEQAQQAKVNAEKAKQDAIALAIANYPKESVPESVRNVTLIPVVGGIKDAGHQAGHQAVDQVCYAGRYPYYFSAEYYKTLDRNIPQLQQIQMDFFEPKNHQTVTNDNIIELCKSYQSMQPEVFNTRMGKAYTDMFTNGRMDQATYMSQLSSSYQNAMKNVCAKVEPENFRLLNVPTDLSARCYDAKALAVAYKLNCEKNTSGPLRNCACEGDFVKKYWNNANVSTTTISYSSRTNSAVARDASAECR
jgi:hypothetical protein